MKPSLAVLALSVLAVASGCAVTPIAARREEAVIEALRQQAAAWDRAIVAKDRDRIAANMADGFRQIDRAGAVHGKDAFLRAVLDARLEIEPYTVGELDIRLHGDMALVMGRTRMQGRFDGEPFAIHYRFVDVYVLGGGEWKIVNVQITGLGEASASTK
jgi:ketosteroid isomerase-like protein